MTKRFVVLVSLLAVGLTASEPQARPLATSPVSKAAKVDEVVAQSQKLSDANQFERAQSLLKARLATAKTARERETLSNALADVHFWWAQASKETSDFPKVIAHYLQAYATDKTLRPEDAATELNNIGSAYQSLNRPDDALRYYQQALTLRRKVKDRSGEAITLDNIGSVYEDLNRYEDALRYHQLAAPLFHEVKDKNNEAMALNSIGDAYKNLNRPADGLHYYQSALSLRRVVKDRAGEATTLDNMGSVSEKLNRYDDALRYHHLALPIFHEVKDREGEAVVLDNLGGIYEKLNRYEEALRYYQRARPLFHEFGAKSDAAINLSNIGNVYYRLKRYDQALHYYQLSLPLRREVKDRVGEAIVLGNIATVYQWSNRYAEALRYYHLTLPIFREIKDKSDEATTLDSIGQVYQRSNRYQEALRYYQLALPLVREVNDKLGEANTLTSIGNAYDVLNRSNDAFRYYTLSLPIFRYVKDRQGEAVTLNNLMWLFKDTPQQSLAIFYGKQSVNLTQSIRRDIQGLDLQSRAAFLEGNKSTYETLAALLIEAGRLPEAEQVTRMLKAQETFDFVRRDADLSTLPEILALSPEEREYVKRYNELGTATTTIGVRLAALEAKRPSQRTEAEKTELLKLRADEQAVNARWEIFRRELTVAFAPAKTGNSAELEKVDVAASDAWQKALQKLEAQNSGPTALLSTVIAPDRFYIVLTSAHGRQQFSTPIKSADLNALVNRLRTTLKDPFLDPVPAAKALYNVLFCNGQLETALQALQVKTALWSLSGSLRYIPLDVLHDGKGYLLERDRINAVMTLTSKDYFDAPQGGDALALGTSKPHTVLLKDPAGQSEAVSFAGLEDVPDEVRGIIHEDGKGGVGPLGGELLLDGDFTAQSLEDALHEGYRTVHIATHFRLLPGDDRSSFLLLGDGKPLPVFDWKVKMPLSGVELLTLSACETGVAGGSGATTGTRSRAGRQRGGETESSSGAEVGSLGEIAQRLGAASVVASLWPVADSSTSLLMRDFYTRWQKNSQGGKGQALRLAQRDLLMGTITPQNTPFRAGSRGAIGGTNALPDVQPFHADPRRPYAHPFYWAPFFLTGNWR